MKDIETLILCSDPRCGACRILERNGVRDPYYHLKTLLMFALLGGLLWYVHPDWFTKAWHWLWATPPCQCRLLSQGRSLQFFAHWWR